MGNSNLYRQAPLEPFPLCVDKIRACAMYDICERTFDTHFADLPKIKIGRATRYLISDLVAKLESLRIEAEAE